ncbi:RhoGAP domain containing protein [Reticulomyxa filosa]|uniref:RhoGAP domain containing protein n=1 Tax=Reticulomyxa filosa TaxID=46433 RepID=X6NS34_RETFI|nr:RhoGAP domain containing protein [Reticulomyxa filosa]|eukprot:ETO28748.1 RhoGAP domain containing protein [Reticulomyxa filosa]
MAEVDDNSSFEATSEKQANTKVDDYIAQHNKLAESVRQFEETRKKILKKKLREQTYFLIKTKKKEKAEASEQKEEKKEEDTTKDNNTAQKDDNVDIDALSKSCLNKGIFFGKSYEECELIHLPQYAVAIPAGLEGLKRRLLECEYITIINNNNKNNNDKNEKRIEGNVLNNGSKISELQCTPIEMAQVLKSWFREVLCDDPGFVTLKLLEARTEAEVKDAFTELTEPRRSVLLWIFDLWIEVEQRCNKNKMTLQSMSIVFSPNLVRTGDASNPMIFLQYQKEAQRVLEIAAHLRKSGQLQFDTAVLFLIPLFSFFLKPHLYKKKNLMYCSFCF